MYIFFLQFPISGVFSFKKKRDFVIYLLNSDPEKDLKVLSAGCVWLCV